MIEPCRFALKRAPTPLCRDGSSFAFLINVCDVETYKTFIQVVLWSISVGILYHDFAKQKAVRRTRGGAAAGTIEKMTVFIWKAEDVRLRTSNRR